MLTKEIHNEAIQAAKTAVADLRAKHGRRFTGCGFAWVDAYVKGNTKLGKSFIAQGFSKSYTGGYSLWDPAQTDDQDITEKEVGAQAYVDVICKYMPEVKIYTGSRLD